MKFRQRFFDPNSLWMLSPEQTAGIFNRISQDVTPDAPLSPVVDVDDDDEAGEEPPYELENGLAIIALAGVVVRSASETECEYFGLCSMEEVAEAITHANANPDVSAILLNIDSPGGEACGTPEIAELVANSVKPVCAFTSGMMASAAYYIGSQADLVLASKSAVVGSIGTIMTTYDFTGYLAKLGIKPTVFTDSALKGAGHQAQALTKEQSDYLQGIVDQIGAEFRATVKAARGDVADSTMQGQIFIGASAKAALLIDEISDLNRAKQSALDLVTIK